MPESNIADVSAPLISALNGLLPSRLPIWIMRQAGRYLPEYRALRSQYSFLELMRTPDLAVEVSLQPLKRFDLDGVILFSDILTLLDLLDLSFDFHDKVGPVISKPVQSTKSIESICNTSINFDKIDYVFKAITLLKKKLSKEKTLIGFSGAPFTIASYMIEGRPSTNLRYTKALLRENPRQMHQLLDLLTSIIIDYISKQANHGIEVCQLFDTWASLLPVDDYIQFCLPYVKKISEAISIPFGYFCKYMFPLIPVLNQCSFNYISLDWHSNIYEARKILAKDIIIQGNLDPSVLLTSSPHVLESYLDHYIRFYNANPLYIFNLGHGILPETPIENLYHTIAYLRKKTNE